ncbi:MAG TPA: hypothetical protein VKH19_10090 [Gemmatimonadaceae bacterium]|nr:hypothetical protein [Gemmatimonadaceae bacterium]
MSNGNEREPASPQQVEGRHGNKTHARFVEQLHETTPDTATDTTDSTRAAEAKGQPVVGHHRLHEDRQQHDEAEKDSEKTRAEREVRRGHEDENVIAQARVPHEGDSR